MPALSTRTLPAVAATIDIALTLVFAAAGRESHHRSPGFPGVLETAWPFLAGLVIGWLVIRAWQRPWKIWPTGIVLWISAVVIGMILRAVTGQGIAPAFIVVATLFLGASYLLPRAIAALIHRRRDRRAAL